MAACSNSVAKPSKLRPPTPIPKKRKWKEIKIDEKDLYSQEMEGFVCLEELDSYSTNDFVSADGSSVAVYKDQRKGDTKKKRKGSKRLKSDKAEHTVASQTSSIDKNAETTSTTPRPRGSRLPTRKVKAATIRKASSPAPDVDVQATTDTECQDNSCANSEWRGYGVPDQIIKALMEKKFTTPTPIQKLALPAAIQNWQDVIGAAETGSGKTLAFGIPILTRVLELKSKATEEKPLYCLILAPTRELALQVCQHIKDAAKYCDVDCIAIVGGLSTQKQERLLGKSPEIVVATPGRLNSLLKDGHPHLLGIKSVPLFAVDEVDRMLEHGHFKDLTELFEVMQLDKKKRQTFIFSATLAVPKYHKHWSNASVTKGGEMQKLMDKLKINAKARVIDLTKKHVTATGLNQWRILCSLEEKDLYLYYFLLLHPGRTLVFVNSIGSAKRLCSIFAILKKNPHQLHAGKQQKQRLKALDRFASQENSLLIATDVAARGLDIKDVDHVVHYQLPKDPSLYVHRSGRTARACSDGQSLMLESAGDFQSYKKICELVKMPSGIPNLPVDHLYLLQMKKRLDLARKIDKEQHSSDKKASDDAWMRNAAKSMDIDDDDSDDGNDSESDGKRKKKFDENTLKALKQQLDSLLKLPILPQGFSGSYPTMSGVMQKLGVNAL